jgi:hypothetical protein
MALFAAAEFGGCQALVVEDTPSLRDQIRAQVAEDTGSVGTTLGAGALEFVSLPDRAEPSESAPQLRVPSLWIAGAEQPTATLQGTLRAYYEMGGDKQLWVLPGTGAPPHSLLTHDGEYQRAVAQFLCAALGGAPERVDVRWRQLGGRTDAGLWEVTLDRRNAGDAAVPWAVQVCALDRDAGATWQNVWVQGSQQTLRLELTREPGVVGAMRIAEVERTEAGAWKPPGSPLSRAGRWYEEQQELLAKVRGDAAELPQVKAVAAAIQAREDVEQLPPQLDAELADVYWALGRVLTQSTDAEDKARGLGWLRRASAAQPEHPERHFWPGRQPTWGFRHARAVQAARERLVQIEGGTQAPGR